MIYKAKSSKCLINLKKQAFVCSIFCSKTQVYKLTEVQGWWVKGVSEIGECSRSVFSPQIVFLSFPSYFRNLTGLPFHQPLGL